MNSHATTTEYPVGATVVYYVETRPGSYAETSGVVVQEDDNRRRVAFGGRIGTRWVYVDELDAANS